MRNVVIGVLLLLSIVVTTMPAPAVTVVGQPTFGAYTTAMIGRLASKQATLISGTNIKTINSTSILGSGNITTTGGTVTSITATSPLTGGTITTTGTIGLGSVPFKNISSAGNGQYAKKTTTVNGQALSSNVTITTISGNAGTATALAANGTNCSSGQAAAGVDASGNAEGCFTPAGGVPYTGATADVDLGSHNISANKITLPGSLYDSSLQAGTFEIQSYATNNGALNSNVYFDGSNLRYRATGKGASLQFADGPIEFILYPSGTGGSVIASDRHIATMDIAAGGYPQLRINSASGGDYTGLCVNTPSTPDILASTQLNTLSYNTKPLVVQGQASQVVSLTEWQRSDGTVLSGIAGNGQITSALSTGTAPLSVASTTLNTNLNADLLDGQHGSYYVPSTRTVNGQALSSNVTITTVSGNAGTATALAANGTNCTGVTVAQGVDASGNAESCITPAGTYSLPTASSSVLGGVKPDGTSILNTAGVLSATAASVGAAAQSCGTFTATLTASVTSPTTPITITANYCKTGSVVYVNGNFAAKNTTGAVGDLIVSGLPFTSTAANTSDGSAWMYGLGAAGCVPSMDGTATQFTCVIPATSANVLIVAGAGIYFHFTLTYLTTP